MGGLWPTTYRPQALDREPDRWPLPTPTYTSNFNATVNAQCSPMINPRVVIYIDEPIVNVLTVNTLPYVWGPQFNCVKEDTMILGDNLCIKDVVPGTDVITKSGINRVVHKFERVYNGNMIKVKAVGVLPIEITPEHPLLVVSGRRKRIKGESDRRIMLLTEPYWKEAKDLVVKSRNGGDYLLIPRMKGIFSEDELNLSMTRSIPLDEDIAWLLGLYVAEGNVHYSRGRASYAVISLNKNETDIQRRVLAIAKAVGIKTSVYTKWYDGGIQISLRDSSLAKSLVGWCGKGAENKQIPEFILLHKNQCIVESFLHGYLEGDGHEWDSGFSAATVSRVLAQQLQLMCSRLGIAAGLCMKPPTTGQIRGLTIHSREQYWVVAQTAFRSIRREKIVLDDYIAMPVSGIERVSFSGKVHNIETTDNTYLVQNAIVHNCWGPLGETTSYHQYVPIVYAGWLFTGVDYFKSNDAILSYGDFGGVVMPAVHPPNFPAGWRIDVVVNTDLSGHVVSASVTVYDASGGIWTSSTTPVTMLTGWLPDWSAIISCFSIEFGSADSQVSNYTSGKGRIVYIPEVGQGFTVDQPVPTPACVQRAGQHTAETSNMKYSEMIPQADGSLLQYYAWDGNFIVTGPPPPAPTVLTLTPRRT